MTEARVRVIIPANSRFVALARVTTASLAAEADFSIDEIEELRVGADELIAFLVEWAEDRKANEIAIDYHLSTDRLEMTGTVVGKHDGADGSAVLDVLTERILAAVVDDFEIGPGQGRIAKARSIE